jgi:hypothetical protein
MNNSFNSDPVVQKEIERLKEIFNIKCAIETGTYNGETTKFLAQKFEEVYSVEITDHYFNESSNNCSNFNNVKIYKDSSEKFLSKILPTLENKFDNFLFYLDAHWENYWPLKDELKEISLHIKNRAIIVIDDFFVPQRNFQYDSYQNIKCDFDYIKDELNLCYDSFTYYYLNRTERNLPIRDGSIGGVGKIYVIPNSLIKEDTNLFFTENNNNYSNI